MVKQHTRYICQQCGRTTPREMGKCPQCGAWNSIVAERITTKTIKDNKGISSSTLSPSKPRPINQILTKILIYYFTWLQGAKI